MEIHLKCIECGSVLETDFHGFGGNPLAAIVHVKPCPVCTSSRQQHAEHQSQKRTKHNYICNDLNSIASTKEN